MKNLCLMLAICLVGLIVCSEPEDKTPKASGISTEQVPTFELVASEYPSWSVFMVAAKAGLISGGVEPGTLEKKWNVRVKVQAKDYDTCLALYGDSRVDAVCITNIDSLNPALGRPSTAILPTSTSFGADKVISTLNFNKVPESELAGVVAKVLKGQKTHGLSRSVSEFVFVRGLQKLDLKPADYPFVNLDPSAAATALQTKSENVQTICVWNPFALQALRTNSQAKVLFDSTIIPEEVIDMVVVGNDALKREGGDRFASCICDAYYTVCKKLRDPKSSEAVLKALGEDFSSLPVAGMKICTEETKFYATPEEGIRLFTSPEFPRTMEMVVRTCKSLDIIKSPPTISYEDGSTQLNFDIKYMKDVSSKP